MISDGITEACEFGAVEELVDALSSEPPRFESLQWGAIRAIQRGSAEMLEVLLRCGARADFLIAEAGWSLVHLATQAFDGDPLLIRFLVQHGADINSQHSRGMTPLHIGIDVEADLGWQQGGRAPT